MRVELAWGSGEVWVWDRPRWRGCLSSVFAENHGPKRRLDATWIARFAVSIRSHEPRQGRVRSRKYLNEQNEQMVD